MANRDVVEIVDHPDPIEFTTEDGATHRFLFNYVIVMRDGRRIAVAARYGEEAIYARATLPLVEPFMSNDFADTAMVMSEEDVDPVALFNAGWMLDCSRSRDNHINQEHDRIALAAVERLLRPGPKTKLEVLIQATGLEGMGFRALTRLIDDGVLELVRPEKIERSSLVRRAA